VLRLRILYNENQESIARDIELRVYSPPHFLSPTKPVGPTLEARLTALDSLNPLTVAEIATILGALGSNEAVPKLLGILKTESEKYVQDYKNNILPLPYYRERGSTPERALYNMYESIFWALKEITGDYHEAILGEMEPKARSIGEKALERLKQS
jgi:hypothetical protein